jgi:hypothetical protein
MEVFKEYYTPLTLGMIGGYVGEDSMFVLIHVNLIPIKFKKLYWKCYSVSELDC